MKAHEAMLVQEDLAGDRVEVEQARSPVGRQPTRGGYLHLLLEDIEQKLAPSDRRAIREMMSSPASSWQQIGDVAVRMLDDESH